jgi:hypothetical protein
LPFCELHGREAELAAREVMAASLEGIFTGMGAVEQERNETAVEIIEKAAHGLCLTPSPTEPRCSPRTLPTSWKVTPTPTP